MNDSSKTGVPTFTYDGRLEPENLFGRYFTLFKSVGHAHQMGAFNRVAQFSRPVTTNHNGETTVEEIMSIYIFQQASSNFLLHIIMPIERRSANKSETSTSTNPP